MLKSEICTSTPTLNTHTKVSSIKERKSKHVRARRAVPDFCPYRTVSNSDTSSHCRHNGFQSQSEPNRACKVVATLGQLNTKVHAMLKWPGLVSRNYYRSLLAGITTVATWRDSLSTGPNVNRIQVGST